MVTDYQTSPIFLRFSSLLESPLDIGNFASSPLANCTSAISLTAILILALIWPGLLTNMAQTPRHDFLS